MYVFVRVLIMNTYMYIHVHVHTRCMQPLLTAEELAETKRQVEVFAKPGGVGETLQKKLEERAASRVSWVSSDSLHNSVTRGKRH